MKIIDFHTHFGDGFPHVVPGEGWGWIDTSGLMRLHEILGYRRFFLRGEPWPLLQRAILKEQKKRLSRATPENLRARMRRAGITFSVVLPVEPYVDSGTVIEESFKREGFIPFCSVSPWDPEKGKKLETYIRRGARGLKVHPVLQRFDPEAGEFMELLEEFAPFRLPIISHTGRSKYFDGPDPCEFFGRVERFEKAIRNFPGIRFVLAHMGMHNPKAAVEMAGRFRNVYLETSFQEKRVLSMAIEELSADRLLFGSDWPCASPSVSKRLLLLVTGRDPVARSLVFHLNAESLLGL